MIILLSIVCIIWFRYEIARFPEKINRQFYADYISLTENRPSFEQFSSQTTLKLKYLHTGWWLGFPIIGIAVSTYSFNIAAIAFILMYLSLVDKLYYLTDIDYVGIIFIFSLTELLFFSVGNLKEHLFCLLATILFLSAFAKISHMILKREGLGSGDILLLIALSPLWVVEQMLQLLLYASSLGILFYLGSRWLAHTVLPKLPFIPFISIGWLILCLQYK